MIEQQFAAGKQIYAAGFTCNEQMYMLWNKGIEIYKFILKILKDIYLHYKWTYMNFDHHDKYTHM